MGGALWGVYDERAEKNSFQDAIREWRGGGASSSQAAGAGSGGGEGGGGGGGLGHSSSLAPSDVNWKPTQLQCCWECLKKFTDRGHWSSLAEKQFCSRGCGEKYEKSRRLKRASPPPPKRKVACQRCFNLCSQETSVPVPDPGGGSTGKFFCTKMCADLSGVMGVMGTTTGDASGGGGDGGVGVPSPPGGGFDGAPPPGGAPSGRAPRSAAAAGLSGAPGATAKAGGGGGGKSGIGGAGGGIGRSGGGRVCPECEGGVNIMKGAVGVVIAGLGSRLCCSRKCADAVLARPTPDDEDEAASDNKENNASMAAGGEVLSIHSHSHPLS